MKQWYVNSSVSPIYFFLFYKKVKEKDASGKNAKLSWCKCIFDQIKANLAEIQPKNHQNDQETPFLQKAPGVNGFIVPEL